MKDMEIKTEKFYRKITKNKAKILIEKYFSDVNFKKMILDKLARPMFIFIFKKFFNRKYVFGVKLKENLNLIISVDREDFWVSKKTLIEIK
ncbi:MAG: hypothetical protein ACTSVV_00270 [Promethearchaeota archaeon]